MVSGEKRNCEGDNVFEKITTILLDIEGTTTSISFVKDILFPYARENLKAYIESHWDDEEFKEDLKQLKLQAKKDEEDKIENFCPIEEGENEKESLIKNILWQMDLDRKTTALKQLQGHIWREGYENGKLKGHVYSDVSQMFKKWFEDGRKLYIYSSGSVEAQKLLFKNSESGDLQGLITGYFDTQVGPKTEASSYTKIAETIGCGSGEILFLTDVVKEAVAAEKAGMQVMIVVRDGNTPLTDDEKKAFPAISSFKELVFETSNKKKKLCDEENVGKETGKAENVEKMEEESCENKNGEAETMEVETDVKEDCKEEKKTEESEKCEAAVASNDNNEPTQDNIDVDVEDTNTESGEKVVSSSVDDGEIKKDELTTNGEAEETPETNKVEGQEEEAADSTNVAVEGNAEATEEPSPASEDKENVKETSEVKDGKEEEQSVNGHDKEAATEVNGREANDKFEEISETVPLKKVTPEDQADSTIEVTA